MSKELNIPFNMPQVQARVKRKGKGKASTSVPGNYKPAPKREITDPRDYTSGEDFVEDNILLYPTFDLILDSAEVRKLIQGTLHRYQVNPKKLCEKVKVNVDYFTAWMNSRVTAPASRRFKHCHLIVVCSELGIQIRGRAIVEKEFKPDEGITNKFLV